MQRNSWRYALLSLTLGSVAVQADVPITVKAMIVVPACDIAGESGEARLEVPFGEIAQRDAGTAKAERSVRIKISCRGGVPVGKSLQMYLTPTAYGMMKNMGTNVLATSMTGIGIALTHDKTVFDIGKWLPIEAGLFTLTGQLVIQNGTDLQGGTFSAGASLFASYM
ncbi:fimbrial protein [Serratia fonticola]|uniref:fimbrial protein n=1 Tax=Serratia fonticola TaxID=47917 RepID=UPI00192CE3B1|nr:fimbrial protein [Serratia fonticola]MBL5903240.1 fimbrial protein [Serratia fonticola]